ncbi:DUF4333 domain-containing protein [Micromonospora sonneratiae]|uniref:DUF4333 domain-containing protein n=1 Tax=Micromonospora sonneratiae TaxID=1184706 RepID=A0ABW3YPE7_9ACTN
MTGVGAVLVVVLAVVLVRVLSTPVFDSKAMEKGIAGVLTRDFGEGDVSDVRCPSEQKVEKDATFTCTVKVKGAEKRVTIKVVNEQNGEYEVGQPH